MSQLKEKTCGFCKGKGDVTLNIGQRACTSCEGKGTLSLPASYKKCKKCKGIGKIGWRKCSVCNATGWVE